MDASYYSPLTKLYQGHLQQPSLTLDLPLLHAARPHALPPSLLVPTHTFALPQAKSSARSSLPPSSRSSHVLDCSFVPGHPSLLVCSTAPAGLVVSVDLATGQAVQSFLLPPLAEPRLDGLCSGVDPAVPLPSLARPAPSAASLSCAQMHGDPSSPLLFLGTSAGDIFAYDLRFAGRGGPRDTRGCPTLHLEGAHDGIVSAVRAGGGANTLCARSTALPSHVLISGGLQDNWIRLFDLRFPFHYSSGPRRREARARLGRGRAKTASAAGSGRLRAGGREAASRTRRTPFNSIPLAAPPEPRETYSFPPRSRRGGSASAHAGGRATRGRTSPTYPLTGHWRWLSQRRSSATVH
ncbi:hypothetical protein BESB_040710 [Besnoitia besnoiti]|uniref:Uncharacterized protein n=1 Tax=Besnoitia besnoiti TaxID=94643 RepID=A0A2A9MNS1_BESBE|nr:hypothetical protein BESB_040710 [Besnoitia besnoiti]PFH37613.1 hypothetical protein BESB_040710 [Besnoitia besnoiti]